MGLGMTSYATRVIISKGLARTNALNGLITGKRFHLYVQKPEPRANRAFGGGPYPGAAWNKVDDINNFYQPVDKQIAKEVEETPFYQVPVENEQEFLAKKINVVMKARIGNQEYEKIYSLNEKWEPLAVTVTNLTNVTYQRITAIAENIKRIAKKATFVVENFKGKK